MAGALEREGTLSPLFETVSGPYRSELREKGSRFIASVRPAGDAGAAQEELETVRREYPDATHHCWAYRIAATPHDLERSHDDGEPAGTAGAPILQAIRTSGLINLLVVVTRYFGGTRLGKGGLARAYRDSAREALAGAPRIRAVRECRLRLHGPVERVGEVRHLIARCGGTVLGETYGDDGEAQLAILVPSAAEGGLREGLVTLTRGDWSACGSDHDGAR